MLYNEKLVLNNIRKLRKEKKLTQDEVSKFLGIARGSYAKNKTTKDNAKVNIPK